MGWLVTTKGMERGRRYGRDLYDDPLIRAIDRLYMLWVVLTLGIPFAIGYAVGGTWQARPDGMVWGGLVRIFLFHHMTWSVNSVCHMFGRRDYRPRDEAATTGSSRCSTFGEGWHNNHHAFPGSASHGLGRRQFDVTWWTIRALERLGLVWDVKVPTRGSCTAASSPPDRLGGAIERPLQAGERLVHRLPEQGCSSGSAILRSPFRRMSAV